MIDGTPVEVAGVTTKIIFEMHDEDLPVNPPGVNQ
jgi:hypothetical protein